MAKLGREYEPLYFTPAPVRGKYLQGLWEGGDAPSAPDPIASAAAQTQINNDAARLNTRLNRANQITPFGSLTWTNNGGFDQAGYDAAMRRYNEMQATGSGGGSQPGNIYTMQPSIGPGGDIIIPDGRNGSAGNGITTGSPPRREDFTTPGDDWTSTYTLNPEQQNLLNSQTSLNQGRLDIANALLGQAGQSLSTPLSTNGLPDRVYDVGFRDVQGGGAYGASAGAGQAAIDLANMTALPTVSDETRQRVEQALYERAKSRLDPMWQQQQDAMQTNLANQGITLGSKAYDTSVGQFGRDRNDAYETALRDAIVGGGQEQSRLFDLALKPRQQEFAERSKQADVSMSNASNSTNASIASAANATQAAIANAQMNLAAQNANNQNALLAAQFRNQAHDSGLNERIQLRELPLTEIAALSSGAAPTLPNFGSTQSGASVNPANYMGAQQLAYNGQLAGYNADTQSNNALLGAAGSMGAGLLGNSAVGTALASACS